MTDEIIRTFLKFDESNWIEYLSELCYGLKTDPSLESISTELISQLFWIYNELDEISKETRLLFTHCLLQVFREVPAKQNNARLIYNIIYFVHEARPTEHRPFLELLVRDESFTHLNFGKDNLHLLLIKAYTYIEDKEKMFLQDYLVSTRYQNMPYFLYLITNYYGTLEQTEKALEAFCDYFIEDGGKKLNEEFCKEVYHALSDSIPQSIELSDLLDRIINHYIRINHENQHLSLYIKKFINELKSRMNNLGLVLFAEDVINHTLDNYSTSKEIYELAKEEKYNGLINIYVKQVEHERRNIIPNIDELLYETIKSDPKKAFQTMEQYFTQTGN